MSEADAKGAGPGRPTMDADRTDDVVRALDAQYAAVLAEVRDALDHTEHLQYVELIDRGPADPGDQSVGDALADLNVAMLDRHVEALRDIEAARRRLREGGFGICSECRDPIDVERLLAYPTATRCVRCQAQHERTYARTGTPTL